MRMAATTARDTVTATPFAKPFNPSRGKTIKGVAMSASPEAIAAIWEVAEVIFSPSSVRRAQPVLDGLGHSQNHNLGTLRVKYVQRRRSHLDRGHRSHRPSLRCF